MFSLLLKDLISDFYLIFFLSIYHSKTKFLQSSDLFPRPVGAFDKAVNKNPSLPPPRAIESADLANARNLQQFNELKNKGKLSYT